MKWTLALLRRATNNETHLSSPLVSLTSQHRSFAQSKLVMECRLTYLSSFRSFIPPLQNCTCIQCSVYLDNWWNLKSCKDGFKKFSKQRQNFSPVFKISIKFSTENSSQFKNQSKLVIECHLTYLSSFHLFIPPFQNCTCIEISVYLEN